MSVPVQGPVFHLQTFDANGDSLANQYIAPDVDILAGQTSVTLTLPAGSIDVTNVTAAQQAKGGVTS